MPATKADIIAQLQKEILPLQGFRATQASQAVDTGLGPIATAFPTGAFPLGAVHEFICSGAEAAAASSGFLAGLTASLMRNGGTSLWISSSRYLFPPALKMFGIEPEKIIFVDLQRERDILWAMEEALKCGALATVIAEMHELSFMASRRLQLAVEQSQVTGFILRRNLRNLTTACVTRWQVTPMASESADGLPGVGLPHWNVELLKVRNGKPGSWHVKWADGKFQPVYKIPSIIHLPKKKTG